MGPQERLAELGLVLPEFLGTLGSYAPCYRHGDVLVVSGHTARSVEYPARPGVVGVDLSVSEAAGEAEKAALNLLSTINNAVGLSNLLGIIYLRGFVRSGSEFVEHPAVVDGASKLLRHVLPHAAGHARMALGAISLPGGACVELEGTFLVTSQPL